MRFAITFAGLALAGLGQAQTGLSSFNTLGNAKLGTPSSYLKAINFTSGTTTQTVLGINFTTDATTSGFSTLAPSYQTGISPTFGSSTDEDAFEAVMGETARSTGAQVGGTFSGLAPGSYVLKMYWFENFWPNGARRAFDVVVDGQTLLTKATPLGGANNTSYVFETPVTVGVNGSFSAFTVNGNYQGFDNNPMISAMTLQSAVPEPVTVAALGIGLFGLARRKRR
jgi:hypothetical protein